MLVDWNWGDSLRVVHVVILVAILAFNIFLFFRTRSTRIVQDLQKALADGDGELRKAIELHATNFGATVRDHALRISNLETTIRFMPRHNDLLEINRGLSDLANAVAAIAERSSTTQEMVLSIQNFLREVNR